MSEFLTHFSIPRIPQANPAQPVTGGEATAHEASGRRHAARDDDVGHMPVFITLIRLAMAMLAAMAMLMAAHLASQGLM